MPAKPQPDFAPRPLPEPSRRFRGARTLLVGRIILLTGFALLVLLPPLIQVVMEARVGRAPSFLDWPKMTGKTLAERLRKYEKHLENQSAVEYLFRLTYTDLVYQFFREGNRKVLVAHGNTLHLKEDLRSITGRDPSRPLPKSVTKEVAAHRWTSSTDAVVDFGKQLRARGIQLMLVPVPTKASIYPETLGLQSNQPPVNPYQEAIYNHLRGEGVDVLDLAPALWNTHGKSRLYLERDTHWTPEGMSLAAQEIANAIKSYKDFPQWTAGRPALNVELLPNSVTSLGDLDAALGFRDRSPFHKPETVQTQRVIDAASAKPVEADPDSPIVLLGDSFSVIYSGQATKFDWGTSAGLPEHLMARLGTRVENVSLLGGGATAARHVLLEKHGSLPGKKLVVWVLASRLLLMDEDGMRGSTDPWEKTPIPATGGGTHGADKAPAATEPVPAAAELPEGALVHFRGKVIASPPVIDPSATGYSNLLIEVTFQPTQILAGAFPDSKPVKVLFWGFQDAKLTGTVPQLGQEYELLLAKRVPNEYAQENRTKATTMTDGKGEVLLLRTYWPMESKKLSP